MWPELKLLAPSDDLPSGDPTFHALPPPRPEGWGKVAALTGNAAAALALRQVRPDVAAAFPITPQTELMHAFSKYVADGEVDTEFVTVESEHSAMSVVIGAAAAGARAFTATSSNGLAYMIEPLTNAGALRLPIVLALVNRHVGGLLNIHCDHTDAMLARNACWLMLFAEDAQEAYDLVVQAFRLAEDPRIRLPAMVCFDGFVVSHTVERVRVLSDEAVSAFVGEHVPEVDLLDVACPVAMGPLVLPPDTMPLYAQVSLTLREAPAVIEEVARAWAAVAGRPGGMLESFAMEGAEMAIVAMGSAAGTARAHVTRLRSRGVPVGLIKIRAFRPFPGAEIAARLSGLGAVAVIDRALDLGSGGPLFGEVMAALAVHQAATGAPMPHVVDVVAGIGGRDVTAADMNGVVRLLGDVMEGRVPLDHDPVWMMNLPDDRTHELPSGHTRDVVLLARGGQGAKTAAMLMAEVLVALGHHAVGFPTYGPERSGAPLRATVRVSERPIQGREPVSWPTAVALFDLGLAEPEAALLRAVPEDGWVLVNSVGSADDARAALPSVRGRVAALDATGIAMAEVGGDFPNAAILGALCRLLGFEELDALAGALAARMRGHDPARAEGNRRAVLRGAEEVRT